MENNLIIEYKRMLQRRGNLVDIGDLDHAEIALVEDMESLYYGVNGKALKVLGESSLENSLESNDNKKALTANKGRELNLKITALERFVNDYLSSVTNSFKGKQDVIVQKSSNPPENNELIWFKTN